MSIDPARVLGAVLPMIGGIALVIYCLLLLVERRKKP